MSFLSLPVELVGNILLYLDCDSLAAMNRTCWLARNSFKEYSSRILIPVFLRACTSLFTFEPYVDRLLKHKRYVSLHGKLRREFFRKQARPGSITIEIYKPFVDTLLQQIEASVQLGVMSQGGIRLLLRSTRQMGLGHFKPLDNILTKALPLSCPSSEGGDTKKLGPEERRHARRCNIDPNLQLIKTMDKLYKELDWRSPRYGRHFLKDRALSYEVEGLGDVVTLVDSCSSTASLFGDGPSERRYRPRKGKASYF
jgi:hypothetical protein